MFKTANEVAEALRKREEEEREKKEKQYEKIRNKIEKEIEDYIKNDEPNLVCHFDIPDEIQKELAAAGYLVLHFVEGLGYNAYVLKWDAERSGIGEYRGNYYQVASPWRG